MCLDSVYLLNTAEDVNYETIMSSNFVAHGFLECPLYVGISETTNKSWYYCGLFDVHVIITHHVISRNSVSRKC
jgi:hypothetical protein